jgi:diguanylate cyclase (GGDEF)-like protein
VVATTLDLAWRRRLAAGFGVALVAAIVVVAFNTGSAAAAYETPQLWIMTILAALTGTQAFVSSTPQGNVMPVVLGTSLCFTFAILLSWGLGPAVIAQTGTMIVIAIRLRRSVHPFDIFGALGGYALAFITAEAVLLIAKPDPVHHHTPGRITSDALIVLAAIIAWLITYTLYTIIMSRLARPGPRTMPARDVVVQHILFRAALLMLSPLLAIAVRLNIGFVFLIFIPLWAVERMAKLSAQRDQATRQDPLTGLANRDGLKAAYNALSDVHEPHATGRAAVLLADLDDFKHVNDALGHEVGDQLLIAVARRLSQLPLGADGAVARLGGDEFALLTTVYGPDDVHRIAIEASAALREPVMLYGLRVDIAASIGTAVDTGEDDFAAIMRHADIAMYDAKHSGVAVTAYQASTHHDSVARLALVNDLRLALEGPDDGQISLYYQPQIDLGTDRVDGVEALLRWHHPVHGAIGTELLLGMVEHSSVMHMLTTRVITDVIQQVGQWTSAGLDIRASINVSARDLYSDELVPMMAGLLKRYAVDPGRIQVEITESALMGDPQRAMGTVNRLSALGIALSLDDFGTGYSSLQHLRRMPISEIKIDRSFVAAMADNHDDAAIVRSTIGLARSLGIRTVAEGVENEYTRALLSDAGCTLIQGWLTAKPMPVRDITPWLMRARVGGSPAHVRPSR